MSSCRASVLVPLLRASGPYEPFSYRSAAQLPTAAADSADMTTRLLTLIGIAAVTGTAGISLNLPSNPSISNTLDGTDQVASWSALLGIVDARGTGSGWNLTVAATAFSDGGGHSLAAGTLTGVTSACRAGNSC